MIQHRRTRTIAKSKRSANPRAGRKIRGAARPKHGWASSGDVQSKASAGRRWAHRPAHTLSGAGLGFSCSLGISCGLYFVGLAGLIRNTISAPQVSMWLISLSAALGLTIGLRLPRTFAPALLWGRPVKVGAGDEGLDLGSARLEDFQLSAITLSALTLLGGAMLTATPFLARLAGFSFDYMNHHFVLPEAVFRVVIFFILSFATALPAMLILGLTWSCKLPGDGLGELGRLWRLSALLTGIPAGVLIGRLLSQRFLDGIMPVFTAALILFVLSLIFAATATRTQPVLTSSYSA